MTKPEARKLAAKWRAEGKSYSEIASMLKKSGYASSRTGGELTSNAVALMLRRHKESSQEGEAQAPRQLAHTPLEAIKALVKIPGVAAQTKLQWIESVLN